MIMEIKTAIYYSIVCLFFCAISMSIGWRIGKVLQAADDGISILDKPPIQTGGAK